MDNRLVLAKARDGSAEGVLHSRKSARRPGSGELRSLSSKYQNSAQSAKGRLSLVRAQLLPPLPSRRAPSGAGGHIDESHRATLHQTPSLAMSDVVQKEPQWLNPLTIRFVQYVRLK